ncbi:MAG: hypothetical protein K8R59_04920 [Thermoanaerobaculales bacterium]|nr:hypothetical protein [Thermoanaerobaculales bacterium]
MKNMMSNPRVPFLLLILAPILLLGLVVAAAALGGPDPGKTVASLASAAEEQPVDWNAVDDLISEQKFQAALDAVVVIRQKAEEGEDAGEWARALVEMTKLRVALHGYETAIRELLRSPWPEDPTLRAVLDLYSAQAMVAYSHAYSWEIRERERVISDDEVDLKRWTMDQIVAAVHRSYARLWADRDEWEDASLGDFSRYVSQNNYPPRIRGTLRDAISYLWSDLLADTSLWRPEQSAEIYRLDLAALAEGEPGLNEGALIDTRAHPLARLSAILGDLEQWHFSEGRTEAGLEARYERIRRLHSAVSNSDDERDLREGLQEHLEGVDHSFEWWAMGQSVVAEFLRGEERPDALVRAREIALAGLERHPEGVAGGRCRHVVASIEAPSYSLESMALDGAGRRSMRVTHRNFEAVYFRAWRLDLDELIHSSRDYNLLPGYREVPDYVERRAPVASWKVDLPATPDYRNHKTDVVPPLNQHGLYLVAASARSDFRPEGNHRVALNFFVSDLVLIRRPVGRHWEITARAGFLGSVLEGVGIDLYRADWRRGHRRVSSQVTNRDGLATFEVGDDSRHYFLVGRNGEDLALVNGLNRIWDHDTGTKTSAFIYTDRSVYRPRQTVHWKIVPFSGGEDHRWKTLAGESTIVTLVDGNGEEVAQETVRTNDFGSAFGTFEIPAGRLLGRWQIKSSLGYASTSFRVEEYKRPTFEVELLEPESALRLNTPARLNGEVRYYFGLPVTEGKAVWRVTREPVYPRWWGWWWPMPQVQTTVIASGETNLGTDGAFAIEFTPEADEREAARGVTYRFRLSVDTTDPGGETRSASRTFRLGFTAVEATLDAGKGFLTAGETSAVEIVRSDLDGTPRAGRASWRLIRLDQPERTLTPAKQPLPQVDDPDSYTTQGDLSRPRWGRNYDVEQVLFSWSEGRRVVVGELEHGENGRAEVEIPGLDPGPYRLVYKTEDAFGAPYENRIHLVVAEGEGTRLTLPAFLAADNTSVAVGGTARLFVHSGFPGQSMVLELFRQGRRFDRQFLRVGRDSSIIEIPIDDSLRGGFGATLTLLRDHQLVTLTTGVFVPWDDKVLQLEFATFRDRLRPGTRETFRVKVRSADGSAVDREAAEVLAYMYDRSLDIFAPHTPPAVTTLYPSLMGTKIPSATLGSSSLVWQDRSGLGWISPRPVLSGDHLRMLDGYGIGGPGRRGGHWAMKSRSMVAMAMPAPAADPEVMMEDAVAEAAPAFGLQEGDDELLLGVEDGDEPPQPEGVELRSDFSETAFFLPQLTIDDGGGVDIEFEVPDSVTEWNFWVHALTRDLRGASERRDLRTVKELMVRPAVPRFLREGDQANLKVVVNNGGEEVLEGVLRLELIDPDTDEDLRQAFDIDVQAAEGMPFVVEPGAGTTLEILLRVPPRPGLVAFRVTATAGEFSDGELRPLPVLPGRMHLMQSRFAALQDADRRELAFPDMMAEDPSLIHDQLVVSVDAQLFYGVLDVLPYLVDYPYECTEQTLNRFLSTGIVSSVFEHYPAVAQMAAKMAERESRLEAWDDDDPNRKLVLEETPWLRQSRGGDDEAEDLIKVLDPRIAEVQRRAGLADLEKAQTSLGAFPWWPGGPPSPYMTLYVLAGFAHALEFDVDVPKDVVVDAWAYMHRHYVDEIVDEMVNEDCCWETITWLNFVLSSYPDESWTGGVFTAEDRLRMLEMSFRHWKRHSPRIKSYLALTLHRADRTEDARLVWESVMDSAKTDRDLGTYWAPEERSWLWYNDTVETHAVALRTLTELDPDDSRRLGLVQWIFLNKKLNHWSSTRTTAEVVYSLVHYLEHEGQLGVEEEALVTVGPLQRRFVFDPNEFTGRDARFIVPGDEIDPRTMATVVVEKESPGIAFATATWHFSTEKMPEKGDGDLFSVERFFYRRSLQGDEWVLEPLVEGMELGVGDQVEVELGISARHAAEYVHVRDPRGAGFEPESLRSGWRWDLGVAAYEEVRDSGSNLFFEWLPAGEYTFRYRLRAAMGGTFKVAPAVMQSMYAPEFGAYSAGHTIVVGG